MQYRTGEHRQAGLAHDPFKAIVAPRPIGWISAMAADGAVNLSPYSFFNAFSGRPPIVGFSSEGIKDAVAFVAETREFVCNLASFDLAEAMNATSAPLPRGESEFVHAGLEMAPSMLVKAPRVRRASAALECRLIDIVQPTLLSGHKADCFIVLGEVVAFHIDDRFVRNGRLDTAAMRPIARLGYDEYAVVDRTFAITRPPGAD